MTLQEIESELNRLRALEEARRKHWRSVRRSATICGLLFLFAGAGLMGAALILDPTSSTSHGHALQEGAVMFILVAAPMVWLRAALIDSVLLG
jgi:hypothetical protein